jgi:mycothiol synthase
MTTIAPAAAKTSYTFRPACLDDMPGLRELQVALATVQSNTTVSSLEDVRADFNDPWVTPETDTRLALAPDGRVAAYARLMANPEPPGAPIGHLDLDVHPAHRAQGLEAPLLDWLEARAAERLHALAAAYPGRPAPHMRVYCWDDEPEAIARFEQRGFAPVRYFRRMRRDLRQPLPERPLPAGLTLRTHAPELDEGMLATLNETFQDGWSFEPISASDWQQFIVQRSTFRPDLTFAALEGKTVVAICVNYFNPETAERTGFNMGWIGSLGVRRGWRKRGLGSALLAASMRAFRAAGLDYAGLGVDAHNPTGAYGLYESLGFQAYTRSRVLHKTV